MTMAQARRILYDLALTIDVHPLALGVIPESTGQVYLPKSVYIDTIVISDIIAYKNEASKSAVFERKTRFDQDKTENIPPLIKSLEVGMVKKKGLIRAVVVVEHRNLKKVLTNNEFIVGNIILVMVRPNSLKAACL